MLLPVYLVSIFSLLPIVLDMSFPKIHSSTSVRPLGEMKVRTSDREMLTLKRFSEEVRAPVAAPLSCNLSSRFVLCGPSGVGGVRDGAPGDTRV